MCDIERERNKIDAILERAAAMAPVRDCIDAEFLAEFTFAVLSEHYCDACPDECLRKRCIEFAARTADRRRDALSRKPAQYPRSDRLDARCRSTCG